jgi:hypothetical protein
VRSRNALGVVRVVGVPRRSFVRVLWSDRNGKSLRNICKSEKRNKRGYRALIFGELGAGAPAKWGTALRDVPPVPEMRQRKSQAGKVYRDETRSFSLYLADTACQLSPVANLQMPRVEGSPNTHSPPGDVPPSARSFKNYSLSDVDLGFLGGPRD